MAAKPPSVVYNIKKNDTVLVLTYQINIKQMKKTFLQLVVVALAVGTFFTSCGAGKLNNKAEETATAFYNHLQSKSYDSALNLCSEKAFGKYDKAQWTKAFEKNAALLGEIKSFKKTSGFNIESSTSFGTTVAIAFDVQWQYGKSQDSVLLIKEKDGSMKVYRYTWLHSDTKYLTELDESEKKATDYLNNVKAGNFAGAAALCSELALKITPKEQWIGFLEKAAGKYGAMTSYNVIRDSCGYNISGKGDAGFGNYYDIIIESNRGSGKMMEKIVFFQKNYEDPVKLTGHYFL